MLYTIADFYVEYEPRYARLTERSQKYVAENQQNEPEIKISVSEAEIDEHVSKYEVSRDLAEYVIMGLKFYDAILGKNAFFLHSSAVAVDGEGFAFTGPCGAGKSTHSSLWRKYFGSRLVSVNDDKPVVRIIDDTVYVCGTPFSGKHDINSNTIVPLKGICVLNQAKENSIVRLKAIEAMSVIMEQTLRSEEPSKMAALLDVLDITLQRVPVFSLSCNISFEAVELAYNTLDGNEN
ncbi:MAG: hypothetical protein IJW04_02130 [Ruminococcus sp.]|nr:hypothetical protein [Ruminococcus sp.]